MIRIVDDQKDIGTGLERLLPYAGHESVSVTGGAEALAMLHVRKPSLLILDVNMPEMDGLEFTRLLRGSYAPAVIPIIGNVACTYVLCCVVAHCSVTEWLLNIMPNKQMVYVKPLLKINYYLLNFCIILRALRQD